jgi:hypothetical protein
MPSPFVGNDPYLEGAIGFDLLVNYRKPPDVPLDDAKQNEWVATHLAHFRQG